MSEKPHPALPDAGEIALNRHPDFRVSVQYEEGKRGAFGMADVTTPGRSFSCLVSDLPYLLLCECLRSAELKEALEESRAATQSQRPAETPPRDCAPVPTLAPPQ